MLINNSEFLLKIKVKFLELIFVFHLAEMEVSFQTSSNVPISDLINLKIK